MQPADSTPRERLDLLRAEDIKARFLLYGHTVWALHCLEHWTGFEPISWNRYCARMHERAGLQS